MLCFFEQKQEYACILEVHTFYAGTSFLHSEIIIVAAVHQVLAKKQAALKREAAEERELPTCPICCCVFYITESPEAVDAHLTSCSRKAAAAAAAAEAGEEATVAAVGSTGQTAAVVAISSPMPMSLSSTMVIGLDGSDLGSLDAAVEELAVRGMRPTVALCDRAMQGMLKSRYVLYATKKYVDFWHPFLCVCVAREGD